MKQNKKKPIYKPRTKKNEVLNDNEINQSLTIEINNTIKKEKQTEAKEISKEVTKIENQNTLNDTENNLIDSENEVKTLSYTKKRKSPKNTGVLNGTDLLDNHKLIIDEYYVNGFNKSKAVQEFMPNVKSQSAAVHMYNSIASSPKAKKYIDAIQTRLRGQNHIQREQVLNEFISWSYADATEYIGLSEKEVKELPPNVRRQIQSYKITERTETDRKGQEVTVKTIDLKLVNKLDALKETAKIIGAYELDNNQKRGTTDLTDTTPETQEALFKALLMIERDKKANKV